MNPSTNILNLFIFVVSIIVLAQSQAVKYNGWIETRKLFLFGADNGFQSNQFGAVHNFLFEREFDNVPRVGLAVYTIDFQYSPDFSCRITSDTNKTATGIRIAAASTNINNLLYVMYIATDHQQVGIFVPDRLYTSEISVPTRKTNVQNFNFNFKQQISSLAKTFNDITLTVYLTGVSTTSQMTNNGYPLNRTSLALRVSSSSTRFYTIQVTIGSQYPEVLIDWVECTVVYFIPQILLQNQYQANSGIVTQKSFGGTRQPVRQSVSFIPLLNNNKFQNLKFFFGINRIDCRNGASVTILGVQKYFTDPNQNIVLSLQMQTWKLTFIETSSYNYMQYKSLKCNQTGSNCKQKCGDGIRPYYTIQNKCDYCHFSCLTCNDTKLNNYCDSCSKTRQRNQITNLCECKPQFYETFIKNQCQSCFPCATCERKNTCQTCLQTANMILNTVKSQCECKSGYFPNLLPNSTNFNQTKPCLGCSQHCLYCDTPKNCLACSMQTYLLNGSCIVLCNENQKFNQNNQKCQSFDGDLFDQKGRLGFNWNLRYGQNQMFIDLIFSQTDLEYYYFQNKDGYNQTDFMKQNSQNTNGGGNPKSGQSFFYNDGMNQQGYGQSGSNSPSPNGQQSTPSVIDQSALRGQYYGLGQATFFAQLYQKYDASFKDQFKIPYGKYKLSKTPQVSEPNYIDSLAKNIVFTIGNETIPFSIDGNSNNRFILRARPSKTYINQIGAIQVKNTGLIRSNTTALQTKKVTKNIQRFDYYSGQQLSIAKGIQNSNSFFINIFWGISKYFLFIGFGWPFIPIMMAMQYIMSFNYINTNIPINLDRFLSSFKDFRNPSILFNPQRDNFDAQLLSHPNMYKSIPELQEFDRGLDFMKNSWQFFFVPMLAVGLLGLLYLVNLLLRKFCRRDFCMISKFLVPRLPLLIAAYTMVQGLPVSFFFFSQLQDTTFLHSLQPNRIYPIFNTAMAYLAFFLTCAIPILLLAWLYYHFNYGSRISKFSDANVFNKKFLNKIQNSSGKLSRAQLHNPLWGGDQTKIRTYILGAGLFLLPVVFGFFLAYFIHSFSWQIVGLIVSSAIFVGFLLASTFIKDKIIKAFLVVFLVLVIGYLFLHAGIGSNRTMDTFDKWNIGYVGIGLLYALILISILFTGYLLYQFFQSAYLNHKKYGCWIDIDKQHDVYDKKQVQRVQQYRRDTNLKSTFLKLKSGVMANNQLISNYNQGNNQSNNQGALLSNNNFNNQTSINPNISTNNKIGSENLALLDSDNLISNIRLLQRYDINKPYLQQLVLKQTNKNKKQIIYITRNTKMLYAFPQQKYRNMLQIRQPLFVDGQNKIYDKYQQFIDYYFNLIKVQQPIKDNQIIKNNQQSAMFGYNSNNAIFGYNSNNAILSNQFTNIKKTTSEKQIFIIKGQQYQKITDQINGQVKLKNINTGQINLFNLNNFDKQAQHLFKYNSQKIFNNISQNSSYHISNNLISKNQIQNYGNNNIIIIQGIQYEQLGFDQQGRHRLYSSQLKKYLLLTTQEYLKYKNKTTKNSQNLLLESAVGTIKKDKQLKQQMQINLIGEDQLYYIFEGQNGRSIFIPKSKIDTQLPIQIDQYQNIIQNGKIIVTKQQSRNRKYHQNINMNIITNNNTINIDNNTIKSQTRLISHQSIQLASRQNILNSIEQAQIKQKQQVSATDVINPNSYYTILGIPAQKVIDFQYQPNDIVLNLINIKGNQVMIKVQQIQQKYPQMSILVKSQSDQNQQFWLA